ncbi:hypothetical protein ALMP_14180 [Streptomyces sp. A012304]|nr:hypothetical protein ALMP_14180 [Streptomyces sp. A012304]
MSDAGNQRRERRGGQGRGRTDSAAATVRPPRRRRQAAFAFVAYMSTYSCPDSRITSAITESVTARST